MPPTLSWNPLRYVNSMIDEGRPTLEEVCAEARDLGFTHVEWHYGVVQPHTPERMREVRRLQERYGLRVSQWTCAPDFTHPDPAERARQLEEMKRQVELAREIGAAGVRVTAGCRHPGVTEEEGIEWAVQGLLALADYAQPRGIRLGYENHYRDRRWTAEDFSFQPETFLRIFRRIESSWVGVNFDCSNSLMTHNDPMEVLRVVKHKVWHVHASDRFPGRYDHSVIGEGSVDFDPIFACLAAIGYRGYISLEDNNPEGHAGTVRALAFIRRKVAEHWKE